MIPAMICPDPLWAVIWAEKKHAGQTRSGDRAYIVHPIGVAKILKAHGVIEPEIQCAALLHDILEDTDTTFKELTEQFGSKVAGIVLEVTDNPALSKKEQKQAQIDRAPVLSLKAKFVKLADCLYNVRDLRENPPTWRIESQRGYARGKLDVADAICPDYMNSLSNLLDPRLMDLKISFNKEATETLEFLGI